MADQKLSALTELAAEPASNDELYIRDESEAPASESKRITVANLLAGAGGPTFVHKTSDETLNNTNTLQNDDDLVFAVGANEIWVYQMFLIVNAAPAADFKWAITVPGGTTIDKGGHHGFGGYQIDGSLAVGSEKGASSPSGQVGSDTVRTIMGIVDTAGTSGNVQLQWAQQTAHSSDIKVKIGSYLMAWKVA